MHLLFDRERDRVVLIDGGLGRGFIPKIQDRLKRQGLTMKEVEAILLTHGHFDHTANVKRLHELSGAPVLAHRGDAEWIQGRGRNRGWSRVGGFLEGVWPALTSYRPPRIDEWFADGDRLPYCGGLEVHHLPGHTPGHCGFWSEANQWFFAGDLFAIQFGKPVVPPAIFSFDPAEGWRSLIRANDQIPNSAGVWLNHGSLGSPERDREALSALAKRLNSNSRRG
ncbi:MAG: MBL fold metallo-hydrolase [Verrucomicrobiae bacterium]|nr:MBL fold metallo-hydrolase [Verrucomicrobiae bacterium]